jgi:hypothetical protein
MIIIKAKDSKTFLMTIGSEQRYLVSIKNNYEGFRVRKLGSKTNRNQELEY